LKTPFRLLPLVAEGLVDEVVRQLMSGKEATVYIVRCGEELRCAKVYKDVDKRSFRQAAQYRDGRAVKNTRRARAMEKGSRYGRKSQEEAWQSTEVAALRRAAAGGVRVPRPYLFHEGVLLMELVTDEHGSVAPRLGELEPTPGLAREYHAVLIRDVIRMLCAGMIHGDLSEYNILVGAQGPVIIDMPQVVDAAANNSAENLFQRDVDNLRNFLGRFEPELLNTRYAKEIWSMYAAGKLAPDSVVTGTYADAAAPADVAGVVREIRAAEELEAARLRRLAATE
jgi:RIO kinase 1